MNGTVSYRLLERVLDRMQQEEEDEPFAALAQQVFAAEDEREHPRPQLKLIRAANR